MSEPTKPLDLVFISPKKKPSFFNVKNVAAGYAGDRSEIRIYSHQLWQALTKKQGAIDECDLTWRVVLTWILRRILRRKFR